MSASRRSGRTKKQVDYSLADSPINSDDDFQDSPTGPPPSKKPKTATKPKPKPKTDEKKTKERASSTRKERLSLEEKMYQRELEAAIEASMRESQSSEETKDDQEERDQPVSDTTNKENEDRETIKGMSHAEVAASISKQQEEELDSKTPSSTEQEGDKSDEDDDNLNKDDDDDEDEDFMKDVEDEPSDVDDDDSDFDEEIEMKKKTKDKKGKTPVQSSPTKVGIKPRTSVTVTPIKMLKSQAKKKSAGSSKGSSVKSVSSAESGSASNSPQITLTKPRVLSSSSTNLLTSSNIRKGLGTGLGNLKIQSSGTLRLGLSRNVRVKPLLSKISVHH